MRTVYAIHAVDAAKLADVIEQMRTLGAPRIEVVDCGDYLMALEGSHRLAAAQELGLSPDLVIHSQDDLLDVTTYDWYDAANWAVGSDSEYTAGEVAGELFSVRAPAYRFDA